MLSNQTGPKYPTREEVDFVVVGSGAAGGIMAKELSTAGFSVVVLEQGPRMDPSKFGHDEYGDDEANGIAMTGKHDPQSFKDSEYSSPYRRNSLFYLRTVGGTSVHFTANFWRFHPIDFNERSVLGPMSGTGFADWPITYDELEPYYTKVDWEVGVSGAPGGNSPPRSRPFPMPPLPVKSSGVLFEKACKSLGWSVRPAPMAICSEPYDGRPGCIHCGFCMGWGCEVSAKSTSLATMIPKAEATGRCEIRALCTASRIETDDTGRCKEVVYFDPEGVQQAQLTKAVVVCGNGGETPRLLLMSDSNLFPNGLANSSDKVGRYLMGNGQVHAYGYYEHPLNEFKSVQVTRISQQFYKSDPKRGFYGGGGMDARFQMGPLSFGLGRGLPPGSPRWGREFKKLTGEYFNHVIDVNGHTTNIPMARNRVELDPQLKDRYGRPAMMVTIDDHPDDLKAKQWFLERTIEIVEASGAKRIWSRTPTPSRGRAHLLGTCRMGNDPNESVVDRYNRAHDVPNLFLADGSSLVSSGRGQPTMTIEAIAFRAADHITQFAKRGEI
ncbi:MAG: GMC family oxidoreductase [Bacteroidetes bacterium]|nr:GMC family oxidoreductase [Bacteroidota bacterium]